MGLCVSRGWERTLCLLHCWRISHVHVMDFDQVHPLFPPLQCLPCPLIRPNLMFSLTPWVYQALPLCFECGTGAWVVFRAHKPEENGLCLPQQPSFANSLSAKRGVFLAMPPYTGIWASMVCRPCEVSHNCCEFMCAVALLCLASNVLLQTFTTSSSYNLSTSLSPSDPWTLREGMW